MKIGLLTPNSTYLPQLARSLKCSIEHGFSGAGSADHHLEVVIEPTQHNASASEVATALQRFVTNHGVDVAVAPLNPGLLHGVLATLTGQDLPLIALTLGEDLIAAVDAHPRLFVNSVDLWQSAWLTGFEGVQQHGQIAASISALHDSGYSMSHAFALGVQAAGGSVDHVALTHVASAADDPLDTIAAVLDGAPDFVMGFQTGREGSSFLTRWFEHPASNGTPLALLPLLGAEPIADHAVASFASAIGRWSPDSDDFGTWHQSELARPANGYSLLAFEVGQMLAEVAAQTDGSVGSMCAALATAESNSARGVVRLNSAEDRSQLFHRYEIDAVAGQPLRYRRGAPVEAPGVLYEQVTAARANYEKSGWTNPYLVA